MKARFAHSFRSKGRHRLPYFRPLRGHELEALTAHFPLQPPRPLLGDDQEALTARYPLQPLRPQPLRRRQRSGGFSVASPYR